ncbi:sensor histidine kinase [Stackebrandtia soli]|uniref:sensor histidine kinase n=1 Tax=Stackebrandtia soli TaxID=1892856 RepID=UPI0039E8CD76
MTTPKTRVGRPAWCGRAATAASFAVGLAAGAVGGYVSTGRSGALPPADDWPQFIHALRTGICVVDGEDRISHINAGAATLGLDDDGRLGRDELRELLATVREHGEARDTELEIPSEGDPIVFSVHASPLPDEHVVLELTDVSEVHRVERMRRDFVANVSHELKTPVGAMQLLSEALSDAVDDPVAAARFITRIQHESARMSRLVSELLELSRLQGAEPQPRPKRVPVDRIVLEAFDRSRTAATAKEITLIRSGVGGVVVSGVESQLAMAMSNLVGNAIAYSPTQTTVTVNISLSGEWVRVAVIDQGIGIAPEDAERIFERFYRADPARSRATGGTGLGLAIVKHVAGNHAGRIDVSSMPGKGATFTLSLPVVSTQSGLTEP